MDQEITSISLLTYNMLTPEKKLSFGFKYLVENNKEILDDLLENFLISINKSEFRPGNRNNIIFTATPISPGNIVNVLWSKNEIHINCNIKSGIDSTICKIFTTGMIIEKIKCRKNKNIFPMKYYKSFKIVNFGRCLVPIFNN